MGYKSFDCITNLKTRSMLCDAATVPHRYRYNKISMTSARRSVSAEYCEMKRRLAEAMRILEPDSALINRQRYEASAHLC